jgi:hypothetical protein
LPVVHAAETLPGDSYVQIQGENSSQDGNEAQEPEKLEEPEEPEGSMVPEGQGEESGDQAEEQESNENGPEDGNTDGENETTDQSIGQSSETPSEKEEEGEPDGQEEPEEPEGLESETEGHAPKTMPSIMSNGSHEGSIDNPIPLEIGEFVEVYMEEHSTLYYTITIPEDGTYYARTYKPLEGPEGRGAPNIGTVGLYGSFEQEGQCRYVSSASGYYIEYSKIQLYENDVKLVKIESYYEAGQVRFNVYKESKPKQAVPSVEPGMYENPIGNVTLTAQEGMDVYWDDWGRTDIYWYNVYTQDTEIVDPDTLYVIVKDPITGLQSEILHLQYNIVDGILVPSSEPGSAGGLELSFDSENGYKKVYIETEAGNSYSLGIYNTDGSFMDFSQSDLDIDLRDQNYDYIGWVNSWILRRVASGAAVLDFEAEEKEYFLDIGCNLNGGGVSETYIFKIFKNPPSPPQIDDEDDTYLTEPKNISFTAEEGAEIYYQTIVSDYNYYENGHIKSPLEKLTTPITIDRVMDISLYCLKDGIPSTSYYYGFWNDDLDYPYISPDKEEQIIGTQISIEGTSPGGTIYYTTDGSDPYNSSTRKEYTENTSIQVDGDLQIRAIIKGSSGVYGNVESKFYKEGMSTPYIISHRYDDDEGEYYKIELYSEIVGGNIYYTLDGRDPKTYGVLYYIGEPLIIFGSTLI